jgi:hypothetical protein
LGVVRGGNEFASVSAKGGDEVPVEAGAVDDDAGDGRVGQQGDQLVVTAVFVSGAGCVDGQAGRSGPEGVTTRTPAPPTPTPFPPTRASAGCGPRPSKRASAALQAFLEVGGEHGRDGTRAVAAGVYNHRA